MIRTRLHKWLWRAVVLVLAMLPLQTVAAHGPSDGGANRGDIDGLFTIVFFLALPIFLLVEGLILFAIFRYRRRRASESPAQVEGNRPLELLWTIISFAIVGVLFVLTYRFMTTEYDAKAENEEGTPDLTVHVTGYMFNWDYEYFLGEGEETGVQTTLKLTVPTDRLILLEITSRDVQHSFWVPDLAGKVDAIPGHTNSMWLKVDDPGLYTGNCAEFCGAAHYDMVIELEALEPAAFDTWLADQQAKAGELQAVGTDMETEMPAGDEDRGEALFSGELGCSSCHGAQPGAGPSLSQIRANMTEHPDLTPEQFLRESILKPCAFEMEGFSCNMMPADFGDRLDMQMLADLIEYLKQDED